MLLFLIIEIENELFEIELKLSCLRYNILLSDININFLISLLCHLNKTSFFLYKLEHNMHMSQWK